MKAPEKIYLQACGSCNSEVECKECQWKDLVDNVSWCEDKIFDRDIEYIRKDALLEWAKEMKEQVSIGLNAYGMGEENGKAEMLNKLIEKIQLL